MAISMNVFYFCYAGWGQGLGQGGSGVGAEVGQGVPI